MEFGIKELLYCFSVIFFLALGGVLYYAIFTDAINWMAIAKTMVDQASIILVVFFLSKVGL